MVMSSIFSQIYLHTIIVSLKCSRMNKNTGMMLIHTFSTLQMNASQGFLIPCNTLLIPQEYCFNKDTVAILRLLQRTSDVTWA